MSEHQKPVTTEYRDNWEKIFNPLVRCCACMDTYECGGKYVMGEVMEAHRLPGESISACVRRLVREDDHTADPTLFMNPPMNYLFNPVES